MRTRAYTTVLLLIGVSAAAVRAQDIPPRPEQIAFPGLSFDVPDRSGYREVLGNGIPVYIAEDRLLPLVTVTAYFRGGQYMEPSGLEGLSDLTSETWRTGGAGSLDAQSLDEELDFLAARLSTSIGAVTGSISLNLLAKDLDRGLVLMTDLLLRPRFQEERLAKAREDLLASMKRRNDSTQGIESREWNRLVYGESYWLNRLPTQESVERIGREHLTEFHSRLIDPGNLILVAAGDFEREAMLGKLEQWFGSLPGSGLTIPDIPQPDSRPAPGVYLVHKADVNQGRVSIGHIGLMRPVAEESDLMLANDVLGGGGFTSWILSRVRSDEGLAYSAGSSFGIGSGFPGVFRAFFQSKSASCARAADLVLQLTQQLIAEGAGSEELETSKASFIQTFPNRFQSALQTASLYASDELMKREPDYWKEYRNRVARVTVQTSREAAAMRIHPDQFVVLIVGNAEEILKGDPQHPEIKFEKFGPVTRLPLRDPLTLQPLE